MQAIVIEYPGIYNQRKLYNYLWRVVYDLVITEYGMEEIDEDDIILEAAPTRFTGEGFSLVLVHDEDGVVVYYTPNYDLSRPADGGWWCLQVGQRLIDRDGFAESLREAIIIKPPTPTPAPPKGLDIVSSLQVVSHNVLQTMRVSGLLAKI